MNKTTNEFGVVDQSGIRRQGKRLDEIAMALALIVTGALWLAPKAMFPEGTWLVGVGLILLGLNAARRIRGLKTSGFGIIVGLIASAGRDRSYPRPRPSPRAHSAHHLRGGTGRQSRRRQAGDLRACPTPHNGGPP